MRRRSLIAGGGVGLIGAALAAPAIAQSQPEVKWRLASSFPKSLDTLYGAAEYMAKRIAEATDNKFQIRVFAAGEIVPAFQVLDAVQNNTVEMGHSASYYFVGKDPTFAFDCTIPFGMNARQMNAWMTHGGGLQLMRDFFKGYNNYNIPMGSTGAQMGGWFRKEIKTVADLQGLGANGAQLLPFSKEILDAAYKAAYEFYDETAAKNPKWKAIYEPWKKFLDDVHESFRVNEQQFDNYMLPVKKR